jgi:hypothetical protein
MTGDHWLVFNDEREVSGCHCGFRADLDSDCGWGDSVVEHLLEPIDELRCRLAAAEIKLRAARLALAACAEVREAKSASRLGSCCFNVGTEECVCENPTNWGGL